MLHNDPPVPHVTDQPTPLSLLRELLDCTELNMDDMEEYTRVVVQKAQELLAKQPSN